jgi:hypothetical protein
MQLASDCKDGRSHQNDSASLGHSEIHRLEREGRGRERERGERVSERRISWLQAMGV